MKSGEEGSSSFDCVCVSHSLQGTLQCHIVEADRDARVISLDFAGVAPPISANTSLLPLEHGARISTNFR